jgi:hypothetical protein
MPMPSPNHRTKPLDHGEAGFHLRSLIVLSVVLVQALFHLAAVASSKRLRGRPTCRGGDKGADALLAGIAMIRFGVVTGIGQGSVGAEPGNRSLQQR